MRFSVNGSEQNLKFIGTTLIIYRVLSYISFRSILIMAKDN
ncbi:hypothetical protein HanXRQr2_Chr02g0057651 [Helianthus annuus]|uniref:Uncharacterized protein n=1 Tax=Helianthus annuus TaxID=4232 RepID=A0A9K3NZ20_HELAN|nr:hypothetical protein HanXRQr2_Chr02g0057651 [Helianthus annuus]KAJ0604263.1 hypothetical protein HanHA300_Chr02g0047691 [Helianthus annuus]KAJ0604265.1 hypothetical protein HanHA300_Chr02g0047711 [Helianthus annuus]KAJ0618273.1 hypothetical protein HanHA89_Chr02g0051261 [Helianthus annuus]KAJ0776735.1 hypothetical protein HanLR1_Chr02g0049021 [Helianthus annuus]